MFQTTTRSFSSIIVVPSRGNGGGSSCASQSVATKARRTRMLV
jgi:hypothetical protein